MNHEICFLNKNRQYLLLDNGIWYDANIGYSYNIGDRFGIGKIEQIMSYDDYLTNFPEVQKIEKLGINTDFASGIFIRTIKDNQFIYNYNPMKYQLNVNLDEDLRN